MISWALAAALAVVAFLLGLTIGRRSSGSASVVWTDAKADAAGPRLAPAEAAADAEVVELMRRGRKIEAIKRYRQLTGLGLKESKAAVERMG